MTSMSPFEAYHRLRIAIPKRPELRTKSWPDIHPEHLELMKNLHPYASACFIATQVFCHLVPEAKPYTLGRSHFWAMIGNQVWDATADQFSRPYNNKHEVFPHHLGRLTHFKTFSKRSQELLKECLAL